MRAPALLLASYLLSCLCGAVSVAQPVTDPRSVDSLVRPEFVPADPKELATLDEPGYPVWSPDGRFIAYTSYRSGPANIWLTDVVTKKSHPASPAEGSQHSPRWSPDGKQILYVADKGGDEIYDIYLIDIATGQARNLTQTPGYAETGAGWSPDGRKIVFSSRAKESPSGEIAVVDIATAKIRFLTSGGPADRSRVSPLWSSSDDSIYFYDRAWSSLDTNVMRVKASGESGAPENLTPHQGESLNRLADVSRDGRYVLFGSNEMTGWMNVALLDTRTRKRQWITREQAHHIPASFSPDGKRIAFTRDDWLSTHIFMHDIASSTTQKLTRGEGMHELTTPFPVASTSLGGTKFSPDGKRLAYLNASTSTGDIVMIETTGGKEQVLVDSTPEKLKRSFVRPFAVKFPSTDRRLQIPALVWIPPNLKRDGSHPAVVDIHGGPTEQTRPYLNIPVQLLVARGYVVISPNYRGSLNYDQAFQRANHGDPGGAELSDIHAAADWLIATGYVDAKRVAASGGSWGGYLALMALASQPDRWAAGIALHPVADFHAMYSSSSPWIQAYMRELIGDPVRDEALWRSRSPLTHAARIRAPVLMDAGANDSRTPLTQIKEMERAIRANGGLVELHVEGDSGHFTEDTDAYVDSNLRVVNFLDRHLRAGARQAGD